MSTLALSGFGIFSVVGFGKADWFSLSFPFAFPSFASGKGSSKQKTCIAGVSLFAAGLTWNRYSVNLCRLFQFFVCDGLCDLYGFSRQASLCCAPNQAFRFASLEFGAEEPP